MQLIALIEITIIEIVIKNRLIIAQQKYFITGHLIPDTKLT